MSEPPPEDAAAQADPDTQPVVGRPVWVWAVYGLGVLAGSIFVLSLGFVAFAYATEGDGGAGVNISIRAFVLWLFLVIAALGLFVWRRWGH